MLKNPKGSPFQVFGIVRLFLKICFFSKGSPLQFLWYFTTDWVFKNPKGSLPPFSVSALWDYFLKNCFFSRGSPLQLRQKCWQFRKCPLLARQGLALAGPGASLGPFFAFSIFEYCKLTLGSPFAIFEPWIWRRLGPIPACYVLT